MPRRNRFIFKAFLPLGLLAVAVLALVRRRGDDWEYEQAEPVTEDAPIAPQVSRRRPAARFAYAAAFTTLFFAGASFTAGAGDQTARLMDEDAAALAELGDVAAGVEPTTVEAAPAEAAPVEAAPVEAAPVEAAPVEAVAGRGRAGCRRARSGGCSRGGAPGPPPRRASPPRVTPRIEQRSRQDAASNVVAPAPAQPTDVRAAATPAAAAKPAKPRTPTKQWVVKRAGVAPVVEPEIEHGDDHGEPTIWLNRALPDPTPASARLARSFARDLAAVSKRHGADWAAVLGVLRAQGNRTSVPATTAELNTLAARLAGKDAWKGALAVSGRTTFADRAEALADLYRSVGIEALVTGLEAAKDRLTDRLLADENVWIYGSGREDLEAGRIDVRVIVLLGYLTERHDSLTVSSLFSGHRKFARAGVVSAHTYGHAVDIAAVGELSIAGNQQPGGITESAVRSVLLLPAELQPQQVISLLGLGGPSFPLRDHGDHIHVGF